MVGVISTTTDNQSFTSDTPIYENLNAVTNDYVITTGSNAYSVGPMTISIGKTVTVPVGSVWTIV